MRWSPSQVSSFQTFALQLSISRSFFIKGVLRENQGKSDIQFLTRTTCHFSWAITKKLSDKDGHKLNYVLFLDN